MEIQQKPDYLIFAEGAKSGELSYFPDISRGWGITTEQTQGKPPLEWMNSVFNRVDKNTLYLLQQGVPEWSESVLYPIGAIIKVGGTLYEAKTQNTNLNPTSSSNDWQLVVRFQDATTNQKGIVKLSSSVTSASEVTAATSKAVKEAYDLASNLSSKTLILGEFRLFPFRKGDLPTGWYFRNGDNYLFSSKQGQALNSLSVNYKADHNITIKLLNGEYYINVPNAFNGSGYGYFERPVNGISRQVGSAQDDAMRLLVGKFGRIAGLNFSNSGSLYGTSPAASGIQSGTGGAQYVDLNFDNRLATIVAEENRPMNYGMTPAIYLGVKND